MNVLTKLIRSNQKTDWLGDLGQHVLVSPLTAKKARQIICTGRNTRTEEEIYFEKMGHLPVSRNEGIVFTESFLRSQLHAASDETSKLSSLYRAEIH